MGSEASGESSVSGNQTSGDSAAVRHGIEVGSEHSCIVSNKMGPPRSRQRRWLRNPGSCLPRARRSLPRAAPRGPILRRRGPWTVEWVAHAGVCGRNPRAYGRNPIPEGSEPSAQPSEDCAVPCDRISVGSGGISQSSGPQSLPSYEQGYWREGTGAGCDGDRPRRTKACAYLRREPENITKRTRSPTLNDGGWLRGPK